MSRVPFDPAADYYQLLGVRPGASTEEIQTAYRRLAKAFHPDLHADSAAAGRMARLNVAKSVLLDADTRARYDQLRGGPGSAPVTRAAPAPRTTTTTTVRYAPQQVGAQPRHRVVSQSVGRAASRATFDRQTGILLLVAVPMIAALMLYVFQAFQLSVQPLRAPPSDLNLFSAPAGGRPTTRGAADAVFVMVEAQPPSRELAAKAYNFIMARSDSTPESELLRADARRLLRSANSGDTAGWNSTVADLCHLASRC
ncbi:MAG: J domain-containing protein [Chloroflexi bacterium]|nr:J domain-containing protein [Chloroflexota bacterium]